MSRTPRPAPKLAPPKGPPGFSVRYMDRSVSPADDFYRYATGAWMDQNPVPADKSRWGAFDELTEYNYARLHAVLERAAHSPRGAVQLEVGDFYASAMDQDRRNRLGLAPIGPDLVRIDRVRSRRDLSELLADFHTRWIPLLFHALVDADKKNSRVYSLYLSQGGLSLPDREYYLSPGFGALRKAYDQHIVRVFSLAGESPPEARRHAAMVISLETRLARISRTRTELRDEQRNYHKLSRSKLHSLCPGVNWDNYLARRGGGRLRPVIVGQPEFFRTVAKLLTSLPLSEWKAYARWHLLLASAPFLDEALESEYFRFFQQILLGQKRPEPRWKRAARVADRAIGGALGRLFVDEFFPPAAEAQMKRLVDDLRAVFRGRLRRLPWMTPRTRRRALSKFDGFTVKIGHPKRTRDDSRLRIDRGDYFGNFRRAAEFESRRKMARLGRRVDRDEWKMTPPMVNAYFEATQNQIVFPAGILQPPFFDPSMDDAVNYGGIGLVIGHEITHGYDDQGRQYDEHGNLRDWWSPKDAREFRRRARKVVVEYDRFEPLPGLHVKGALTLGENIADIGGLSVAYEALERRLAKDRGQRKLRDGLSPEQRFFVSYGQIWRQNIREADERRLLTVDEHSPGRFRVLGAVENSDRFFEAFGIRPGTPMWRPAHRRVHIW